MLLDLVLLELQCSQKGFMMRSILGKVKWATASAVKSVSNKT